MAGPRVHFTRRTLLLARAILNPYGGNQVLDGTPVVLSTDNAGVLYTRQAPANANGIILGGAPLTRFATSNPGAGVKATASLAASGLVNPAKNIPVLFSWSEGDTAVTGQQTVVIRDGATGVGPILWQQELGPNGVNQSEQSTIILQPPYSIAGSVNTAMTIEFLAAPAGTGFQCVTIWGLYGT